MFDTKVKYNEFFGPTRKVEASCNRIYRDSLKHSLTFKII
jgi:hypothetical protein